MGDMADYFLDEVMEYEEWLWYMRQKYPDVPEDQSDHFICQVCNWEYSGMTGKYEPPFDG